MKEYRIPHSVNTNLISGKELNIVPALAGAVGALAGFAAAGAAFEGGKQLVGKIMGDIRLLPESRENSLLKITAVG